VFLLAAAEPAVETTGQIPRVRAAPARPPGAADSGIAWIDDMKAAFNAAQQKQAPIMIEFWADWCQPCHWLEERTLTHPSVAEASRRFVALRIDFDRNLAAAQRFGVMALPAILFTDSEGTEILRLNGFVEAPRFLALMKRVPEDVRPFNVLSRRLLANDRDFEALLDMGLLYRKSRLVGSSVYFLQQAVREGNSRKPLPPRLEEAFFYLGENHLQERQWSEAAAAFSALLERFPSSERAPIAHLELAKAYLAQGNREGARKHLSPLLERGADDKLAREARVLLEKI
jgi:FimV-like protein